MSGEEYEVESIQHAKIIRGKHGRKDWSYYVKWKNYGIEDNTWEPPSSFVDGSEHFIHNFWSRVDTNERDWHHLNRFRMGEEFFPTGPPHAKSKAKKAQGSVKASLPTAVESSDESEDEVKSIIDDEDRQKRKRRPSDVPGIVPTKRRRGRKSELEDEGVQTAARSSLRRKQSMPETNSAAMNPKKSAAPTSSRGKSTSSRRIPSASPTSALRSGNQKLDEDSTPDEILLRTKAHQRRAQRTSTDAAAEQEIELELQYPSTPSSEGASGHAEPQESTASDPSFFGIPTLLQGQAEPPQYASTPRESASSMPLHRTRTAKVQLYEDLSIGAGETSGISAKRRLMQQNSNNSLTRATMHADVNSSTGPVRRSGRARVPSFKAGPGRSSSGMVFGSTSLLTAASGALRTIKRKVLPDRRDKEIERGGQGWREDVALAMIDDSDRAVEAAEPLVSPPTGDELLRQAGLDPADTQNLPDFEDDIDAHGEPDPDHWPPEKGSDEQEDVKEQPTAVVINGETIIGVGVTSPAATGEDVPHPAAKGVTPEPSFPAWRMSTIFGPLGLGRETTLVKQEEQAEDRAEPSLSEAMVTQLFLSLDYTTSIPVRLKDTYPPASQLENLVSQPNAGPPGKFYKGEYSAAILQTFRTENSTARLMLDPAADDSHRRHFARFCSRLHAGELFVEMIGLKLFAMCFSDNRELSERLAAPAHLRGLSDTVLVARVAIENHSAYADAVAFADNTQWSASE